MLKLIAAVLFSVSASSVAFAQEAPADACTPDVEAGITVGLDFYDHLSAGEKVDLRMQDCGRKTGTDKDICDCSNFVEHSKGLGFEYSLTDCLMIKQCGEISPLCGV